jgi:glycosyltransferase involved in cell wall biosynthesis
LKIAYITNQYPKVSHTFIRREIRALERQGFEVKRIALRGWEDALPDDEDRQEQKRTQYVLQKGVWGLLWPTLRTLLRAPGRFLAVLTLAVKMARESDRPLVYHFIYLAEACRILSWLAESRVERVHAHFGTNPAEVVMLAHALGGPPYSFTVHGPDEFLRPMGLREKVGRCSFVVAISSFGRSQLFMRCPHKDWSKIKVVHCGLERSFYEVDPSPPVTLPRLVCVGRLCEEKGQLLLIDAAARIVQKGMSLELVLAGDGPSRRRIELLIEEYKLSKYVRITGWISNTEVRKEILAARALVLPTFAEGLPVVIMEAMALRRPVLSTYIAGIPELVRPGQDGWLIPAGSVDELTSAMEECLLMSPEKLEQLGNSARNRLLSRHSADTEAGKLADLFHAVDRC